MFKDYVDPEFTWANFSLEEQAKVIVAPRSNNLLETTRVWGPFWFWLMGSLFLEQVINSCMFAESD